MPILSVGHGLFFVAWVVTVLVMALGIATLGNEESMLSRQRGEGLRERRALIERQDQLRAQLMSEARRDRLEVAIRDLNLPLVPPPRTVPSGSPAAGYELASYRQDPISP